MLQKEQVRETVSRWSAYGLILSCLLFALPCGFAQNPIVTENALAGNPASEWDITGIGDPDIQGFATNISINTGSTVDFKIDVKAPATNFSIKIYRLGYYGGNGARLVADLGNTFVGLQQVSPQYETATGKTDCSNWSVSASWTATGAVSGIYLAKISRNDNGGSSHIAFVVRDDSRNAPILFKTSDATWQAYNGYGGNSLYVNNSGTPVPGFNHATKVSYDRPFYTRGGGGGSSSSEDWLFNAEYPMIRWLERNGYDVSYTTDVDMDRDPTPITPAVHQVLLSIGHDEYWSAAERSRFETARDNGVHLIFFSGNEVYWKTRWEDNHRTLVCYKEGTLGENICGGDCDPDPDAWTGLWRDGCSSTDSNDGCDPENSLTGQISWGDATGSISIPSAFSNHRFWRNTGIASLSNGQTATLPNGTLGYEFDFEQYFDFYPRGRVTLSNTILAGKNHKLSLYRHSSGALVFGAGTVQWSWGLDANHDRGNEPESTDMQQATVNLLADMGVLPASLMTGLVSATPSNDLTAPVTVIASPADAATLEVNTSFSITGTASDAEGVVAGVEISTDGGVTWQLATGTTNWTYNWTPTTEGPATIRARAFDDLGNLEIPTSGQSNYVSVTVGPAGPVVCPCSIWSSGDTPLVANEADNLAVELGVKFQSNITGYITGIRFYKGPLNIGTHRGSLWSANGTLLETALFTSETASGWQEVLFSNPVAISANTTYVASYFAPNGQYSVDINYFATSGIVNNPLTALAEGVDGSNGVYLYNSTSAFPNQSFNSSNYWVDVVFETSIGPDITPPTVQSTTPTDNAVGVATGITPSALFSEGIDQATLTATTFIMESGGNPVSGSISYDQASKTATFIPGVALAHNTTYTLTLVGGASGIADLAANPLAADYSWTFTTGGPPPPPPTDGPGGPILLISSTSNDFSRYPVEILRAQGLNEFTAEDVSQVNATMMADYDVIVLGEFVPNAGLVTDLTNWVDAGGTLIAFRPDPQLSSLLGISPVAGSLAEGYLLVNTGSAPGTGIVNQTIQYHGTADYYTLNGASSLATLYTDPTTATIYPAVTTHDVGANNGKAIAFTYDLARSVVYTRQGNPAWEGQNRDVNATPSDAVIRANDLFYGDAPGDPQPDWINLDKAQIPQADEQLHLLTNIIIQSNLHRGPLPRFWFLPSNFKAAVVMTGDDHASTLTDDFFDSFIALSPDNSQQAVDNWEAVRSSSYLYTNTPLPLVDALNYQSQGFEVGIHINTGCNVWTPTSLAADYSAQLSTFATNFPGIDAPTSHRTHCIAWSDYDTQPLEMVANGMRLDVNYYYWPGSWVQDRPGLFTGSGIPMRFATQDGALIDCYQVATQMTDESGQSIALHIATLLDNAVGTNGFYGVFCANMHTDRLSSISLATDIVNAAQARNVPVVSSRQMLTWLDGRNASSFGNIAWNGNDLSFEVAVGTGADNLYGMVPIASLTGQLLSLTLGGSPIAYQSETIKGIDYALFPTVPGNYVATYGTDVTAPLITNIVATAAPDGLSATITWDTDEPANSAVDFGTDANNLDQNAADGNLVTSHTLVLTNLIPGNTYYFRVTSADLTGNTATEPILAQPALSFAMPIAACFTDQSLADFEQGTLTGTYGNVDEDGLTLAPTIGSEFTVLPPVTEWQSFAWNTGGTSTVNGGTLSVDGARFNTDIGMPFTAGVSLEFRATFGAANFQHIGFGGGNDDVASNGIYTGQNAWAMFSTGSTGVLQARTSANGSTSADVVIPGSFIGTPHLYRIDWNLNSVDYYLDGNLVHSEPITLPGSMRPAISDFNLSAPGITVDWIRLKPYLSPGTFESRVFDAGVPKDWGALSWTADEPTGTSVAISVRTGDQFPLIGPYTAISNSGDQVGTSGRYIQYKADLATSDGALSPVLREVAVACEDTPISSPVVTLDPVAQVVCEGLAVTFESAASGNPIPDVQWQVSTDNGNNWTDILSATSPIYTFTAALADADKQYQAVWTNTAGSATSNAATLGVNPLPAATLIAVTNPICVGDPAELQLTNTSGTGPFSVVVNGTTYASVIEGQTFANPNPALSTIWSPATTGGTQGVDNVDTELGLQFSATVDGVVSGIRFYKTGTDVLTFSVSLWSLGNTTTPLATASYTSDAVPGWKQVDFASPVAIEAGTSYMASYFSPNPNYYAFTANGLNAPVVSPPLTAEASSFNQPGAGFPGTSSTANYWVDVVFLQNDPGPPVTFELTGITDDEGCSQSGSPLSSVTVNSNPRPAGSISTDATAVCGGEPVTLTYNATAGTEPFSLTINGTTYPDINNGVPFATDFAAEPNLGAPVRIWDNTTPNPTTIQDSELVLGVKIRSSEAGVISGIRFFKGWNTAGTETYLVRLWTDGTTGAPGLILAEASASLGDAQSGWQQIDFAQPIAIAANTTYIASLLSPTGYYSFNANYFTAPGGYNEAGSPLTAPATGDSEGPNGLYVYAGDLDFPFPHNSINATNYWVDVAFQAYPAVPAYQLTDIADVLGCTASGSPIDQLDVAVNPCPCDLATAGLVMRLESDWGVELDPSGVNSWKDLSGEDNDLTAVGSPLLTATGGPNGHAFIQLDGVTQKLERTASLSALPAGNDDRTVFLVARYNSAPTIAAGFVYGNSGTDEAFGLTVDDATDNLAITSGTTNFVSNGTPPDGAGAGWLSHAVVLSGGTFTHFKNGEAIGSGSHTFATVLNKIVLGEDLAGTAFAPIDVAAVLVYNRALSPAEREEIEAYLQYKYLGLLTDGLVLHLEADSGVSELSGTVTTWADQSVQGNDLTATGDPQWTTVNGPNEQAYLELDGAGDKLERTAAVLGLPAGSADRTIFLVAAYEAAPNPGIPGFLYGTNNDGEAFGLVVDGSSGNLAVSGGGVDQYTSTIPGIGAGWLIQSAVLASGTLSQYKNGALLQTDNPTLNTLTNAILLGEDPGGNGFANMKVAAVLVYDRALTEAERLQVEAYLQHKYFGIGNACVNVLAKAFLLGPFNTSNGLMNDDLRVNALIPAVDPYPALNFTHLEGGLETIKPDVLTTTGNDAIVDWVFLELRDAGDPTIVVATRSALIQRDGDIVDVNGVSPVRFPNVAPGLYHVAVYHRNHLGIMSANAVQVHR